MKFYFRIFLLIMFFPGLLYSQENKNDTVKKISSFDSMQKLQVQFDEFEFYRDLNYMKMKIPSVSDSNTVWMWTRLVISNSGTVNFSPGSSPSEIIAPLYQQFIEDSKLNPVRYVLGMAQTAAVGYLVYRHIKKYGLFK